MSADLTGLNVMVVDDSLTNLKAAKNVLSEMVDVYTVNSAKRMFEIMESIDPALILLDINMPDMTGMEAIKKLKADPRHKSIPVIFVTSNRDSATELEGLSLGAVDYIMKPFEPLLLKKRVEIHLTLHVQKTMLEEQKARLRDFNNNLWKMVESETEKVGRLQSSLLKTVVDLVESRDDTTGGHINRTMKWLELLLEGMGEMGVYKAETEAWSLEMVVQSSALHDVGKISIADHILKKPAKLTPEEFEAMKLHVDYGVEILDKITSSLPESDRGFMNHARVLASAHHEKWDGTGYPKMLKGEEIPLQGRLMAISDVYDALISKRPYKDPLSPEEAVRIVTEGSGSHFDPKLIEVFRAVSPKFIKHTRLLTQK
jgi:putative two-component system response regulator